MKISDTFEKLVDDFIIESINAELNPLKFIIELVNTQYPIYITKLDADTFTTMTTDEFLTNKKDEMELIIHEYNKFESHSNAK